MNVKHYEVATAPADFLEEIKAGDLVETPNGPGFVSFATDTTMIVYPIDNPDGAEGYLASEVKLVRPAAVDAELESKFTSYRIQTQTSQFAETDIWTVQTTPTNLLEIFDKMIGLKISGDFAKVRLVTSISHYKVDYLTLPD